MFLPVISTRTSFVAGLEVLLGVGQVERQGVLVRRRRTPLRPTCCRRRTAVNSPASAVFLLARV